MNSTPIGKMPGESHCSPREIETYLNRVTSPLLDQIDIYLEVLAVRFREITAERMGESYGAKPADCWGHSTLRTRHGSY